VPGRLPEMFEKMQAAFVRAGDYTQPSTRW
jgi:hypothetical protein